MTDPATLRALAARVALALLCLAAEGEAGE